MSILKFVRPISNCFDSELPCSLPAATVNEVSRQVQEVQKSGKKRGHYSKFSDKEKALVGKYASEHRVLNAVRHIKDMNLKESTVRDWRNIYLKQLHDKVKLAKPGEEVKVTSIEMKKRGRPPLLGKNMDNHLQQLITAMRSRGTPIGTNIVCAVARGILLKHGKSSVEVRDGKFLNKEWARSVLHRMGFTKRRACSKSKTLPQNVSEIQQQFIREIKAAIQIEDIPEDLVFNWDQTAMKIVPGGTWTMEKRNKACQDRCVK